MGDGAASTVFSASIAKVVAIIINAKKLSHLCSDESLKSYS